MTGATGSGAHRRGPRHQGPPCGEAEALTLFFVVVLPGLAVVRLAALRLALLACAENTKAVRPLGSPAHGLWALLSTLAHWPGRKEAGRLREDATEPREARASSRSSLDSRGSETWASGART